jgi:hypothetical protein
MLLENGQLDAIEYSRAEQVQPTPIKERVAFFQTWLYFGLIAEVRKLF